MKIPWILSIVILILGCGQANHNPSDRSVTFEKMANDLEKIRKEYFNSHDYVSAISVMNKVNAGYQKLDSVSKVKFKSGISSVLYNLSCAWSQLNQKDSSVRYLQAAVEAGYADAHWIQCDSDLVNIHGNAGYLAILGKLKETGDFEYILSHHSTYQKESQLLPKYQYQESQALELKKLRNDYHLDSVAGNGDEISRMIRLMSWVHKIVRHDGNSQNPSDKHAAALLEICIKENRGINCRMMATILNEVYLSMGFSSHFVTCLPKDKKDPDCHVITTVYSRDLDKWIWMDPTFETWVKDDAGNFLGIAEVRERLIKGLPVYASEGINWNGNKHDGAEYLHHYMAKNLFQLQIPLVSLSGFESALGDTNKSILNLNNLSNEKNYIQLIPVEFHPENVEAGKKFKGTYYTNDAIQFWQKPEKM